MFPILSSSVYTLLKSKISHNEMEETHRNLLKFVSDFQDFFGQTNMVMNVHLLTHFVGSVQFLGPLWSQSTFPFERNNGCLLKFVNGTSDVLDQMSSKYVLWKSTIELCDNTPDYVFLGKSKKEFVSFDSNERIQFNNTAISVFSRLKKKGIIHTSLLYKKIRTIDYFVRLRNGDIGIIKY